MPLKQKFAQGVWWNLVATVASRTSTLVVAVLVARYLGRAEFGAYAMVNSTLVFLSVFAGFGLGLTNIKHVAELKHQHPERLGRIIGLSHLTALVSGLVMSLVCLLAAPWLSTRILNAPHLIPYLQVGAVLLTATALYGVQTGILTGFQAFKTVARVNFWSALLTLPLTVLLVYWAGLMGAVLSMVGNSLTVLMLSLRAVRQECTAHGLAISYWGSWQERRTLWDFSLPAVFSTSLAAPVVWAANVILVNQSQGYAELGLFNAANLCRMFLIYLQNIVGLVVIPTLSELHGQRSSQDFSRLVNLNLKATWSFGLILGLGGIGLSSWVIGLFGPQFAGGQEVVVLMIVAGILFVAYRTISQALISSGNMWAICFMNIGWAIVLLPLVIFLVPEYGAWGMALAYLMAYTVHLLWALGYAAVKFGRECLQSALPLFLFTMTALVFTLNMQRLAVPLFLGLALALATVVGFWSWHLIPKENRRHILNAVGL